MTLALRRVAGIEYLDLVTSMLQRARLAVPYGGVWEAADLQWWWRKDQHPDPARQIFWFVGDEPVAASVITDWGDSFGWELLSCANDLSDVIETVWAEAIEQIGPHLAHGVEVSVRDGDDVLGSLVSNAGFEPTGEVSISTWMRASDRPDVSALPQGFELTGRPDSQHLPHHLIARNGDRVAGFLAQCSLYRPELDLAVYAPNGDLAAYCLFWADPVTGVGLVEPMRTEIAYQQQGLGRHVLAAGLERLEQLGCSRLKVMYVEGNEAARRLYLGAGFRPISVTRSYSLRRP